MASRVAARPDGRNGEGQVVSALTTLVRNRALATLMLGHFTNDMLAGVLPILYPLLQDRFDLDNAAIGFVTLAYTSTSSLFQPVFGHISDRHGRRWFAPATLLWSACFVAAYGFADSYGMMLMLAALAGIGSGAFHPVGAASAAAVTDERAKNTAMSLYTVGGTSGWAIGPLVMAALLTLFGSGGSLALLVPGIAVAWLLLGQMRHVERAQRRAPTSAATDDVNAARPRWGVLARVMGVVMLRSWVFLAVLQFVPIWYDDLGYDRAFYAPLVTTIILAGAAGTLAGGALADRVGQRLVVVASIVLAIPALLLFAAFPGGLAFVAGALFGALNDASLSVTLVVAQRLLPGRIGMASGIILGLGFIAGGVGVPITGALADAFGIRTALMLLGSLSACGALLALTVPHDALPGRMPRWATTAGGFEGEAAEQRPSPVRGASGR